MDETNKGFMKHLGGLELKQINDTQYEFIVEVKEMHLNTGKIAHGGLSPTIADTGMGTAAHRVAGDNLIEGNYESLRYGISVADVDNNGTYEFIVAGFGSENLALSYKDNKLKNIIDNEKFTDKKSFTIGVAACDIDSDGYEEIYFL